MARITVNETGTRPVLVITTSVANSNVGIGGNAYLDGNLLSVTCLQDITVTNSTGVFSWSDFCSGSINKITTPSDNEVSTNVVIDDEGWFGNANATPNTSAEFYGVSGLSANKIPIAWRVQLNDSTVTSNVANLTGFYYSGEGFISSLAPTASPDAPVWVSPLTIAVNGDMGSGGF